MTQGFELYAKLGGDASGLNRALNSAQRSVSGTQKALGNLRRVGVFALKGLATAATTAAGTLALLTRQGLRAVDEQAKLARSLDSTIDGLRGVQIAAEDAGVDTGALGTSLQMLNSRLAEAARGTGTAAQAMQRLGLDAQELLRMDVDERMAAIADRMQELGFSAAQAQDALREMGIRNREMALLMIQGGDAIRDARREVDEFGLSINEVDAARIEAANDAFARVGRVIEAIRVELATQLAPIILHVAERFNELVREAGGLRHIIQPQIESVIKVLGVLLNGVRRAQIVFHAWLVGVHAIRLGLLELNRFLGEVLHKSIGFITDQVIDLIETFNQLARFAPGALQIDTSGLRRFSEQQELIMENQERMAQDAKKALLDTQIELYSLLSEPFPGDNFDEWLANLRDAFDDAYVHARATFSDFQSAAEEATGSMFSAMANMAQGLVQQTADMANQVSRHFKSMEEFGMEAARGMQRAMADFFFNPFDDGLKGMLRGFIDVIRRMVAEIMAQAVLKAFLASSLPGAGFLSGLLGRQKGGPVNRGTPYMVGERGPELMVPNASGTIVPNHKLGAGGQSNTITVNINAEDPGAEGRIRTMIERDMAPQIIQAAVGRTVGALSRPRFA